MKDGSGLLTPDLAYPPNPDFGSGVCRRRVHIRREDRLVSASLCDPYHEMECSVRHDGAIVTAIEGRTHRIPTSSCPAAAAQLHEFVGAPLDTATGSFFANRRARRHCTHLFDLAVIAIRHAGMPSGRTTYDAVVPDELDRPVSASVARDGRLVHQWLIRSGRIVQPAAHADRPLGAGFARWAFEAFGSDDLEAATILARTWLIAVGRRYLTEAFAGQSVRINQDMVGRCFAYDAAHVDHTVFNEGQVRDFTAGIRKSE